MESGGWPMPSRCAARVKLRSSATVPADRMHDPARTVPRATLIGTAAVGAIYLVVSGAITALMPRAARITCSDTSRSREMGSSNSSAEMLTPPIA